MRSIFIFGCVACIFLACGGLPNVKDRPVIETPPDLKNDIPIEEKPPSPVIQGSIKPVGNKLKRRQVTARHLSFFQRRHAVERAKLFSNSKTFREGEKLTLALTWFSIKAGDVTMEVRPYVYIGGRKAYHFLATAKSSSALDLIHTVDDWIESYVDVDTFYPYKSALHGVETDRVREGLVLFDYDRRKIEYWSKRVHFSKGTKEKRKTDEISPPGILDIFTSAFYVRALPLKVGQTYFADVYNEGKHITVEAQVLREETLQTDLGEFPAIVVRPVAKFEGILQTSGDSTIWLSNDERHFILKLETKIKIGYLRGKIKKIEDTDYQLPLQEPKEKNNGP